MAINFPASSRIATAPDFGGRPGAALISQSGASAFGPLLVTALDRGLAFRYIVTTGNEADLGAADFLEYFLDKPDVRVITLLLEGIRDFPRLRKLALEALRREKALVLQKVGRSEVGQRAARSHTSIMPSSERLPTRPAISPVIALVTWMASPARMRGALRCSTMTCSFTWPARRSAPCR